METEQLKKILAGLSLVSLLAGASLTVTGCATEGYGTKGGGGYGYQQRPNEGEGTRPKQLKRDEAIVQLALKLTNKEWSPTDKPVVP